MFRSFFIYLSKSLILRRIVTRWSVVWKMASRFISGEEIGDAIGVISRLNSNGINATLDHLGEHTNSPEASIRATQDILHALEIVNQTRVRANISIKLTQIGLNIDRTLCEINLRQILTSAQELNNFIRIDMEDSPVTQVTLDLLFLMHGEGFQNLGIVIQSYLYRSAKDINQLINLRIPVRLCKGAYKEPTEVAYPKKSDVDRAFDDLAEALIKAAQSGNTGGISMDGKFPPLTALATHDEDRIRIACEIAEKVGLEKAKLEFQMLHGIRRDLQQRLAQAGYPVRVYVPYGMEWYPYFMRRLAERPANVWFLLSNLLRK
jgi:proline dehydrogenase